MNNVVSETRKKLENGEIDEVEASSQMQLFRSFIEQCASMLECKEFPDNFTQIVKDIVNISWIIYNNSGLDTGVTDIEYDKFCEYLENNNVEFRAFKSDTNLVTHKYPILRGTISKIHYLHKPETKKALSRKSLDEWIESTERLYYERTGNNINLRDQYVCVFPKWDGVSAIFEFDENGNMERVLTRGFTKDNTAKDITKHFKNIPAPDSIRFLSNGKAFGLKTEVLVEEDTVKEYNKTYKGEYKQSRSLASAIINSDESGEKDKYLVIMPLRYAIKGKEFECICPGAFDHPCLKCKLGQYDAIESFAQDHHVTEHLRCDGIVIYLVDPKIQEVLGRKDSVNRYEIAYKFTEESEYSYVKDIEFQVGPLGKITPIAKIQSIKLKGNTIKSISLGSIERFNQLYLAKGDMVLVSYDIVPYLSIDEKCTSSGNKPFKLIKKCPSCGKELELSKEGSILRCVNPDCDCRKKGKILNYLSKLRIQDISYASIDKLYDDNILTSIKDLYKLKKHESEIISKDGFGKVMFDNWIKEIESKKRIPDYKLFGAIGIDGCSEGTFKLVFDKVTLVDFLDISAKEKYDKLSEIKGIGKSKAKSIIDGVNENIDLLKYLFKNLDIYHEDNKSKFKVCFTMFRDSSFEKYIISMGGSITERFSSDVNYLIVPNKSISSAKTAAAEKHGIPVVTEEELRSILEK